MFFDLTDVDQLSSPVIVEGRRYEIKRPLTTLFGALPSFSFSMDANTRVKVRFFSTGNGLNHGIPRPLSWIIWVEVNGREVARAISRDGTGRIQDNVLHRRVEQALEDLMDEVKRRATTGR